MAGEPIEDDGLEEQTVDIPLLLPNQTPPKHAGPLGRLSSMVNAQIKHFLPSSQSQPQRVEVIPRDGFTALTAACRSTVDGTTVGSPDWNNPELLAAFGNQLVSVCDSIPRVQNGSTWSYYPNQRVVTNQLSEDVVHTTNRVLAAPDQAYLNGVTCFVWTEQLPSGQQRAMMAMRGDDGAWITAPQVIHIPFSGNLIARVVTDGTYFWTFNNNVAGNITVSVFDTHGARLFLDTSTIPQRWTPSPGYWDIAALNDGAPYIGFIQPHAFSGVGANVGIETYHCTFNGSVITITSVNNVVVLCNGPLAYGRNNVNGSTAPYIVTASSSGNLNGYIMTHVGTVASGYAFSTVLGSATPDSLTGWLDGAFATPTAHAAYSILSNFAPASGPANDPGLRYTRSYACTSGGAVTLTNQVNGVLLSSRAFQIDQDWYAATYYQSGGGTNTVAPQIITPANPTDYFTGAGIQQVNVQTGDFATGAANVSLGSAYLPPTQAIATIPHNAGDQVTAATQNWKFLAGLFQGTGTSAFDGTSTAPSAAGAILHVAGCANAQNNGDWWVQSVASNSNVTTDPISLQGNSIVDETFGVGVTASLTQVWPVILPQNPAFGLGNPSYPDGFTSQRFTGGTVTIAGAAGVNAPANGTYSVFRMYFGQNWRGFTTPFFLSDPKSNLILLTKTSGAAGVAGPPYVVGPGFSASTITISPALANAWGLTGLQSEHDTRSGINVSLVVANAHQPGNNGAFPETANPMPGSPYGEFVDVTGSQANQRAEEFIALLGLPTITRTLTDPSQVYLWHIQAITFDASYLNATLVLSGGVTHPEDNGFYQIVSLVPSDTHAVIVTPIDGRKGQTLLNFAGTETITITRAANAAQPAYQPCWYLTPLSVAQAVAGRWEWAIAYADWRKDGAFSLGTFNANPYPCALSSVTAGPTGKQFALPYRAQSFTAGQTITNSIGGVIGVQSTAESTIGIKLFTLASSPGLPIVNSGEMLLPGAQAGEFSASGFTEDGINLGPEKPYVVGTPASTGGLAITQGSTPQYVVVFEVTSENGDRTWSVTSPPLQVNLSGTQNQITIGGRMPGPTLRTVGIAIYRTINTGTQTIQHYKVTNDLDVNGAGFTFSSVNGGTAPDTWQYVDSSVDSLLFSAQELLTDQGFLQRFPAPANRGGVGSWQNRTWVVGYDGAIWMSGEKDEGDAIWFHPAFRYVLPTDDKPVALAAMENYLLVFCSRSIWFIPAVQFPDATGANGQLPTPQPLPFRNGCTGFAQTLKEGVAYSSTAGGVWLINRSLQNIYLSQPMQDDLQLGITGMTIDGQQRLVVTTGSTSIFVFDQLSQAWLKWSVSPAAQLLTSWQGNAAYEDAGRVMVQAPGTYADIVDGVSTGVALATAMTLILGAVKAMKRVWAINITGQVLGGCRLLASIAYPDDASEPTTNFGPYNLVPGPLNVEINPLIEEATTYDLTITVDFGGILTPAASITLELLTAEVGIEPTLAKRPVSQRITGS